jgi:hypothetical protein
MNYEYEYNKVQVQNTLHLVQYSTGFATSILFSPTNSNQDVLQTISTPTHKTIECHVRLEAIKTILGEFARKRKWSLVPTCTSVCLPTIPQISAESYYSERLL